MSEPTIILATSAPPDRPEYKRDFLTCVAAADGQRVAFSYRKRWIQKELLEGMIGRAATIVFCDQRAGAEEFDFLPFRHAQISELIPAATDELPAEAAITVVFTLGALVDVSGGDLAELRGVWNQTLLAVEHRPRPGDPPTWETWFVFEHPAFAESTGETDPSASWRALSEGLGACETLSDAFFFRIGDVRQPQGASTGRVLTPQPVGSLRRVFSLGPSSEYEVPMDAYSSTGKTPYSEAIAVKSSSEKLSVQAITQSSAGRASEAVLMVLSGEVNRAQIATLVISGAPTFEHLVPRVELTMRIKPKRWLQIVLVVIIACGVLLSGLSTGALGLPEAAVYALKAAGGLIAGYSTLFALGRAPGVGK